MRNNSGRERTDENLLSFLMREKYNDREINEWYNERNQGDKLEVMEDNYYEGHKKLHEQLSDEIFVALREIPESAYIDLFMMLKKFEQFLYKQIAENKN